MNGSYQEQVLTRIAVALECIADSLGGSSGDDSIADAIRDAMPASSDILQAVERGTMLCENPIYASQVLGAIADGTREALRDSR